MNKKPLLLISLLALLAIAAFVFVRTKFKYADDRVFTENNFSILAAYDPEHGIITTRKDSFLHVTMSWFSAGGIDDKQHLLDSIQKSTAPLFLHLEINQQNSRFKKDKAVVEQIIYGLYDRKLKSLTNILKDFRQPVFISINQNAEVPAFAHSWQFQKAKDYINSFVHVYKLLKTELPSAKVVWSPSGYPGTDDYAPPDNAMDLISIRLTNLTEASDERYPPYSGPGEMLRRKLLRLRFFKKPVLIAGTDSFYNKPLPPALTDTLSVQIQRDIAIYHAPAVPINDGQVKVFADGGTTVFGLFDYVDALVNEPEVKAEHVFVGIPEVDTGLLKKYFDNIMSRKHELIVTFEPWNGEGKPRDSSLIKNINEGKYDRAFTNVLQMIAKAPQQVYFRWGHEMEIPITRYPWQSKDPVDYIKAFRRVRKIQKEIAPNALMVWGPAGDRGSMEWYPGDEYVDMVSFAVYGLPDKNISDYNAQRSFSQIFEDKLHRVRFAHRPVFITEFGVKGPQDYKQKWLADAAVTIKKHPIVRGVSYFNFRDVPKAWGDIETPDWSISKESMQKFTRQLFAK